MLQRGVERLAGIVRVISTKQIPESGEQNNVARIDDLTRLSQDQVSYYRAQLAAQQNTLPFLVHPFFELHGYTIRPGYHLTDAVRIMSEPRSNDPHDERQRTIAGHMHMMDHEPYATIDTFRVYMLKLQALLRRVPHVLAVAEVNSVKDEYLRKTEQTFRDLGYKGDILYYTTRPFYPSPHDARIDDFTSVIAGLDNLNTNNQPLHIVVGGQLIEYGKTDHRAKFDEPRRSYTYRTGDAWNQTLPGKFNPKRCVGIFFNRIRETGRFDATISPVSWPEPHPLSLAEIAAARASQASRR